MTSKVVNVFANKTAEIYVVESNQTIRDSMRTVLKAVGFTKIQLFSTIKAAYVHFEEEKTVPDWLICPVMIDDSFSVSHLLGLTLLNKKYRTMQISVLAEPNEIPYLYNLFEMGLLSYHPKSYTSTGLEQIIDELLFYFAESNYDFCLTSSNYVRKLLIQTKEVTKLLNFEDNLLSVYPSKPTIMLKKAEGLYRLGHMELARKTLAQAAFLHKSVAPRAKELATVMDAAIGVQKDFTAMSFADAFDLDHCMIVDSDTTVQSMLSDVLSEMGVKNIVKFEDGESAWDWISKNGSPSFIIQEWRIPKLSGIALLQRIRAKSLKATPVVILSSVITPQDRPLLSEMGVINVIDKPRDRAFLLQSLKEIVQQEAYPIGGLSLERKIKLHLELDEISVALRLKERFMNDTTIDLGTKMSVDAAFELAVGHIHEAEALALRAQGSGVNNTYNLNLLGKIAIRKRDYQLAVKYFRAAFEFSSKNIHRLCLLAESHLELDQNKEASEYINIASNLDEGNPRLLEAKVKNAIIGGDAKNSKEWLNKISDLMPIYHFLNNRGVAFAKGKRHDEGISLYRKALDLLQGKQKDIHALILYNLSLGYIRKDDLPMAKKVLDGALDQAPANSKDKIATLRLKVEGAMNSGKILRLPEHDVGEIVTKVDTNIRTNLNFVPSKALKAPDVLRGDRCVYQIIPASIQMHEQVSKSISKFPLNISKHLPSNF